MKVSINHESDTALGADGTFNGAVYNITELGNLYDYFRVFASSDQTGTLSVQQSWDEVTWFTTISEAVAAGFGSGTIVESMITAPYVRVQYVNGSTAQNDFICLSELRSS